MKYVLIFGLITLATIASGKSPCYDCVVQVKEEDLMNSTEVLNKSSNTLAARDPPIYKIIDINSATRQEFRRTLDRINVTVEDQYNNTKTCDFEILSEPWLKNGTRITRTCVGEKPLVWIRSN